MSGTSHHREEYGHKSNITGGNICGKRSPD